LWPLSLSLMMMSGTELTTLMTIRKEVLMMMVMIDSGFYILHV